MPSQLERDLIATRDRIKDEKNWTQGGCGSIEAIGGWPMAECASVSAMAAVLGGRAATAERRLRYLAVIRALAATFSDEELVEAERQYRGPNDEDMGPPDAYAFVIGFNDSRLSDARGHAEVIAKLDRAIGTEQQRQRPPRPRIAYDTTEAVAELRRKAMEQSGTFEAHKHLECTTWPPVAIVERVP